MLFPSFFNAGKPTYEIEQSLRFDGSSRLDFGSPTSQTVSALTVSCWVKVCMSNSYGATILDRYSAPSTATRAWLIYNAFGTNQFNSYYYTASINGRGLLSSQGRHRDPSAWQHVVFSFDNTAGQYSQKIFINGVDRTNNFSEATNGVVGFEFSSTYPLTIGWNSGEMYLAEYHLISGSQVNYDQFGEFDNNGVWRPKRYTGSYGTNGFYLKFDPTATNGIGHDHSGNGNNFSPTGFTTSGTGTDVMSDTPTTNWATLNPLIVTGRGTISNGNLDYVSGANTAHGNAAGSFALPTSGKWYWEVTSGKNENNESIGVANILNNPQLPAVGSEVGSRTDDYIYRSNGVKRSGGSTSSVTYGSTFTGGDVIGVMWDSDSGTIGFSKNGTDHGTAYSSITQVEGKFVPAASNAEVSSQTTFNFGQRAFAYTPPTGFKALNTSNLPAPTVKDGSDYFNTVLYSGDGSYPRAVTGAGFSPDLVWIKVRNTDYGHVVYDRVRGVGTSATALRVDNTGAEGNSAVGPYVDMDSLDSDGFTLGDTVTAFETLNQSGRPYVAWNWKADNTSGSTNTAGTITSTVSANPTAGFSIVSYTGNGQANATIGHGLGVAPKLIIVKDRDAGRDWAVQHESLGATKGLYLNLTNSAATDSGLWSNTAPTSTVFTVGTAAYTNYGNLASGDKFIAYCFAEVEGYSKFGSYTGNGSTDGPFVYCGFKPAMVIYKNASTTSDWTIVDFARSPYNEVDIILDPSSAASEGDFGTTNRNIDFLSNGFKIRSTAAGGTTALNGSSNTMVFMAFAENPFGGSGVSPATAR